MNDDAPGIGSEEPMPDDISAEESKEEVVTGMLGDIEIPSTGRMLVGLGGAVMALSTLFSWGELGADSFPNIAGVGTSGSGPLVALVGGIMLTRSVKEA